MLPRAAVFFYLVASGSIVFSQTSAPPEIESRTSSLGVKFVALPGRPIFLAQWATRVSDFATFVKATGYAWDHKPDFAQTGDHPVVNVTLQDATAFCDWLTKTEQEKGLINTEQSYRLPTNSEWDTATRSGKAGEDAPLFPWGNEWPPPPGAGNFNSKEINNTDDGFPFTAPVGSFHPTYLSLYDLAGNVWQWALDEETMDPNTATLRGGSWQYFRKENLMGAYRYRVPQNLRKPSVGFRCVFADNLRAKILRVEAKNKAKDNQSIQIKRLTSKPKVTDDEIARVKEELKKTKLKNADEALTLSEVILRDIKTKENAALQNTKPVRPDAEHNGAKN